MIKTIFYLFLFSCFHNMSIAQNVCIDRIIPTELDSTSNFQSVLIKGIKTSDTKISIEVLLKAFEYTNQDENLNYKGIIDLYIANRYKNINNLNQAVFHLDRAEEFAQIHSCKKLQKYCYSTRSDIHWVNKNIEEAIVWRMKYKEFSENKLDSLIADYNLMRLYHEIGDTAFVLTLFERIDLIKFDSTVYHKNLEFQFTLLKTEYVSHVVERQALLKKLKGLAPYINEQNKWGLYLFESKLYEYSEPKRSIDILNEAIESANTIGFIMHQSSARFALMKIHLNLNEYRRAEELMHLIRIEDLNTWQIEYYYEMGIRLNKHFEKTKMALNLSETLLEYKDSINTINENMVYAKWSKKFQTEEKVKQTLLLKKQQIVQQHELDKRALINYGLSLVLVLLFLLVVSIYYQLKVKKRYLTLVSSQKDIIEDQNAKLTEANTTKQKLFTMISHDLITPFNGLLGYIQLLKESLNDELSENAKAMFLQIEQGAYSNYVFVKSLLAWAKSNNNQIVQNNTEINVLDCINAVVEPHLLIFKEKNIHCQINILPNCSLISDEDLLRVILVNLISNALKNTEEDGYISFTFSNQSDYEIRIQNPGLGLTEDEVNLLREKNHNITNHKNDGLGIVICKDILNILGGELQIDSAQFTGTTFNIILPKLSKESVYV